MGENDFFGADIPEITRRLLGLNVILLGWVRFDPRVSMDIRKKQLTSQIAPSSPFTRSLSKVVEKITRMEMQ